jgi:hypothetical protein
MIADEGQPTLLGIRRAHRSTPAQVLSHSTRLYSNSEFQFLLVSNAFFSPYRIGPSATAVYPCTRFASPEEAEALTTDERIGFDVPHSIASGEHSAEGRHHPPCRIVGPAWFNFPLPKQGQLLAEK